MLLTNTAVYMHVCLSGCQEISSRVYHSNRCRERTNIYGDELGGRLLSDKNKRQAVQSPYNLCVHAKSQEKLYIINCVSCSFFVRMDGVDAGGLRHSNYSVMVSSLYAAMQFI